MSKELTEQWREGTLPRGAYYVNRLNEIRIYLITYEDDKNTHEIYEVIAPVPRYDEYKELVTKCHQLQKRLEIATKELKDVSLSLWDEMECRSCAKKALKEMEGVK